ncbi:MAG TPA: hypothetical protein VHR86_01655, partial [Armatimonadota bacterium]|nr:hypothetical protein [Armatimonadota bacterium]
EMNVALAAEKPLLVQEPFPWTDAADLVKAAGCYRGGDAVWVDLAPGPDDSFTLILAPVVVDAEGEASRLTGSVRGWIRPRQALADFLAAYSLAGGTHHAALVYGPPLTALAGFGACIGWDVPVL